MACDIVPSIPEKSFTFSGEQAGQHNNAEGAKTGEGGWRTIQVSTFSHRGFTATRKLCLNTPFLLAQKNNSLSMIVFPLRRCVYLI